MKLEHLPSTSVQWVNCPASLALQTALGSKQESEYAAEGTRAHSVAERYLRGNYDFAPGDTPEMHKCARLYNDFVDTIRAKSIPSMLMEMIEERVEIASTLGMDVEADGTVDYAAAVTTAAGAVELHVVDFKYGKGVAVSPYENTQLICYAAGVLKHTASYRPVTKVYLHIFQPRIYDSALTWGIAHWPDFNSYATKLQNAAKQTGFGNEVIEAIATPGTKQCKWCSVKYKCKGLISMVTELFKLYNLTSYKGDIGQLAENVITLEPSELAQLAEKLEVLALLKKAVDEQIGNLIRSGATVPGFGLGAEGLGHRKFTDEGKVTKILSDAVDRGDAPLTVLKTIPLPPTELCKELKGFDILKEVEKLITRPVIPGRIQRVYNDPTLPDVPLVDLLPGK